MDPVERAIRNALEKGDAGDRTFREKVYRAAFAALERATKSQPQLTVEQAIRRKQNLQARITAIEAEHLPPMPVETQDVAESLIDSIEMRGTEAAVPSIDAPSLDNSSRGGTAPPVGIDNETAPAGSSPAVDLDRPVRGEPRLADTPEAAVAADRDESRTRRRRPLAAIFMTLTLLCMVAIGSWWAYQTGLLDMLREAGTSPSPRLVEEEDFDPGPETVGNLGGSEELRNWITVFSPRDPSGVNAPTGASAEVKEDESGQFIRIRSGAGDADVIFDVGQGILEQIAGTKAVFDISARAEDGTQTQISVSCDFGELGDCGRKRYAVGYERGEFLFDVELPANSPGAAGSIAINSDFSGEGRAVDIFEIRVSVVE